MIVSPRSRIGRIKPSTHPIINWTHPLARGLVACYFPTSSMDLRNLTGLGTNLSPVGSVSMEHTAFGITARSTNPNARCGWVATTSPGVQVQNEGTAIWIGTVPNVPLGGNNPALIGSNYDNVNSNPYVGIYLYLSGGSGTLAAGCSCGGVFSGVVSSTQLMPGLGFRHAATTVRQNALSYIYLDGLPIANWTAQAGAMQYATTSVFTLQTHVTDQTCSDVNCLMGLIYNRQLSAAEILQSYNDPYSFLIFPEDMIFAELAPPVVAVTRRQTFINMV